MTPLRIAVIGAGISGLASALFLRKDGHHVTVFEASSDLTEEGAGIQIPPNAARILKHYGLGEGLEEVGTSHNAIHFKNYATGADLGSVAFASTTQNFYGEPHFVLHRADYQRLLYKAAVREGVDVRFSSHVEYVEQWHPSICVRQASLQFDLVVAADGVKSGTRSDRDIFPDLIQQSSSDVRVYRARVTRKNMLSHPDLAELMETKKVHYWLGPGRHAVGYPIRNGELYNIAVGEIDSRMSDRRAGQASLEELRTILHDFDPLLQKALMVAEGEQSWKLRKHIALERWSSDSRRLVLIGDAAHPMMPYLAQGAAQSIEDAAVLAKCLREVRHNHDIPDAIETFEKLRIPRVRGITQAVMNTSDLWHMPDGREQCKRDEKLALEHEVVGLGMGDLVHTETTVDLPSERCNKLDAGFRRWMLGYDAIAGPGKVMRRSSLD